MNILQVIGMLAIAVWVKIKKPAMYLLLGYGIVSLIIDLYKLIGS